MAVYRYQVVSVGWWRGKIKRWNTTFHLPDSASTNTLYNKMEQAGWKVAGDTAGACSGGVASISIYASTGGAPILTTTYFDWQTPTEWIPYQGSAWSSVDADTPLDASGESAVTIEGLMPSLSITGKPVYTRKFLHHIPSRTEVDYTEPDVSATVQAALATLFPPAYMRAPSGTQPTTVTVDPWYGNHQRVRGRRRTTTQVAAQSFAAGVVAGADAGGGGRPAQFQ